MKHPAPSSRPCTNRPSEHWQDKQHYWHALPCESHDCGFSRNPFQMRAHNFDESKINSNFEV